jgi:hypothetical protein
MKLVRLVTVGLAALSMVVSPTLALAQSSPGLTPCAASAVVGKTSMGVTTSSSTLALPRCGATVILYNLTSQEAFYAISTSSSVTATTSSFSLPGGFYVVLNIGSAQTYLAAIVAANTTTIRITQGTAQ